jgi:hypothetical protein
LLYVFLILVLIPIWFVLRGLRGGIITKDVRTDDRVFFGRIRHDIMFEGETFAFRLDEVVDVLEIEPQPGGKFKYVVHSKVVDGTFVLDEDEIEVSPRPGQ